jgi:DNA-binding MarR family transcriptional regulator
MTPTTTAPAAKTTARAERAPTPVASPSVAVDLLGALRTVVKRLQRTTLPADPRTEAVWRESAPAPRHVAALMYVVAHDRISVSALAEQLGVSLATASQVVTDLEDAALVERVDDPSDRRRTLVQVAEVNRELADGLLDTRLRPVQRALDRMRPAEQRALVRGLELIAEELEN